MVFANSTAPTAPATVDTTAPMTSVNMKAISRRSTVPSNPGPRSKLNSAAPDPDISQALEQLSLDRTDEQTDGNGQHELADRPDQPGQQPDDGTISGGDRSGTILLEEVGSQQSAGDHPEAAADVAGADDGQGRQHAHHETAEECRLQVGGHQDGFFASDHILQEATARRPGWC